MSNIIEQIETQQLRTGIPDFKTGDTVVVNVKVKEGERERAQSFEGVVIAIRNRGLNSAFTVRKISHGEGVERVFPLHSPRVDKVEVDRKGAVRRAKLTYLRKRIGKGATEVKEKDTRKADATKAAVRAGMKRGARTPNATAPTATSRVALTPSSATSDPATEPALSAASAHPSAAPTPAPGTPP